MEFIKLFLFTEVTENTRKTKFASLQRSGNKDHCTGQLNRGSSMIVSAQKEIWEKTPTKMVHFQAVSFAKQHCE